MKKTIWELKQSANPDTLEIYIDESIKPDEYDWWRGEKIISETSAKHFREELGKYPDVKNIDLYVNSYGGDVKEAMGIRSQLKRHPAFVTGYVDGFAASAASFILTGCDKVVMPAPTMQMLHEMWNVSIGNANDHRKNADDLDAIMAGNRQAYLEKSGGKLNEKQLREIMDAETWLTAEQCLEFGLADEVSEKIVDMTKASVALKESNDALAQKNHQLVAKLRQLADPVSSDEIGKVKSIIKSLSKKEKAELGPRYFYDDAQYRHIVERDGKPVGFLENRATGRKGHFNAAVDPAYRGQGIADEMIDHAISDTPAKLPNLEKILWITGRDNEASRKLAEKHGFELTSEEDGEVKYTYLLDKTDPPQEPQQNKPQKFMAALFR